MTENLNLQTVETVDTRPFKKLVMTIGELPTSFVESMTYYELLAWFTNYLETVIIPTVNNNAEAVEELQDNFIEYTTNLTNLFNQLKEFVDNYFDNLDVQEEINNKLDEMVEDGTLLEIVGQYLTSTALWTFDSVSDMQASTNLINGSFAKTLGFYSKNDNGGAVYKIRNITNDDIVDGSTIIEIGDSANQLIAELIMTPVMNIKQFGVTESNTTNTKFQIALTKCEGRKLIIPAGTYRVDSSMNLPDNIEIECFGKITYSGDIIYLFQHPDDTTSGNISFEGIKIEKLDNSFNNLNRFIYVNGGNLKVTNSTFTNYATAIHALHTDNLVCDNNIFVNAHGILAQYGYGIDTSSTNDVITNCRFTNTDNTNGRHCIYLNGDHKIYSYINNMYVQHWHFNPINIAISNTNPNTVIVTNSYYEDACMESAGTSSTEILGCIHASNVTSNTDLTVENLIVNGTKRSAIASVSTTSHLHLKNIRWIPQASEISTNNHGVYVRYQSHDISDIYLDMTNATNYLKGVFARDCKANINNVYSTGFTGDMIYISSSQVNLGLYCGGTVGSTGATTTITPMTLYTAN